MTATKQVRALVKYKVLFACLHNAGRSQIAAAFCRAVVDPETVEVISAGLDPAERVQPDVVRVMKEVGIDLSHVVPVLLTARMQTEIRFLVTMGCGESCPLIHAERREDWNDLADPAGQAIERVREIRDDIRARVQRLVEAKGWARKEQAP